MKTRLFTEKPKHTLEIQFKEMLSKGIMPLFEIELNNGEYLIIELRLNYTNKQENFNGIRFEFDQDSMPVYFDSEIRKLGNGVYLAVLDECFDSLDYYLELISDNITEGFLIPNNLYK